MRVDLALIGFGNVGRQFVRLLEEQRARLLADHDLECRITGIATRRHGILFRADGVDAISAAKLVQSGGSLDALANGSSGERPGRGGHGAQT